MPEEKTKKDPLKKEKEFFKQHSKTLEKEYPKKFIAIKDGRIIDSDKDIGRLATRIGKKYGETPVHIREAKDTRRLKFPRKDKRKRWV